MVRGNSKYARWSSICFALYRERCRASNTNKIRDWCYFSNTDNDSKYKNTNADELTSSNEQVSTQVSQLNADNKSPEAKITLDEAAKKVESFLKTQDRDLAFSIDEETNRSVVIVKDAQSDEVIRQIPSEDVLELAERIKDLQNDIGQTVGMFVDQQV